MRFDGRAADEIRNISFMRNYIPHAEGSVFVEMGNTRIICTASVEEKVPQFLKGSGTGWITAEYGMLPRATVTRTQRESTAGRKGGRTLEIQRLIGRSLRSVIDLSSLGERTFWVDCDVVQANGGTRTASITGAFIAVHDALSYIYNRRQMIEMPIRNNIAAVSVGIVKGEVLLDLNYEEDSHAEIDANFVMTEDGRSVEIQISGEKRPFTNEEFQKMESLAKEGIQKLLSFQKAAMTRPAL
ncbi:MAG: ribonuclease PH [Pseudomonadota bacterium]